MGEAMNDKNIMTSEGQKLYLVTFEFFSSEQRTLFKKGFHAKSEEDLKEGIDKYLMEYYGFKNSSGDDTKFSYYRDDDLAVNLIDWKEIESYELLLFESSKRV